MSVCFFLMLVTLYSVSVNIVAYFWAVLVSVVFWLYYHNFTPMLLGGETLLIHFASMQYMMEVIQLSNVLYEITSQDLILMNNYGE